MTAPRNRHKKISVVGAILALMLMSGLLTGCFGSDKKTVHASSQFYTCIYSHKDGTVQSLPPGGGSKRVKKNSEVWLVPTSERFWNLDTNLDLKDPGAPKGVTGLEANYKNVVANVHADFFVNQTHACDLVDRHGKRNVAADQYGTDDTESEQKMGFNIRGDAAAKEAWFILLNEKLSVAMQEQGEPLLTRYGWEYYELKFPINADTDGKLDCGKVSDTCKAGPRATTALESDYSTAVTDQINEKVGKDYFCGPGYDPEKPNVCPPIGIDITSVSLVDKKPLTDRQKLVDVTEQTANNNRLAELTNQATDAAVAAQEAKLNQAKALQDVIDSYGGVDPGVAEANRNAALDRAKAAGLAAVAAENAKAAAAEKVAPCVIVGAKGDECARILAAIAGNYPQGNGTSVQVNPGN